MSKSKQEFPEWFLWLWGTGFRGLLVVLLAILGTLSGVAYYVDHRIDEMEERLTYQPPPRYVAPKLDDFAPSVAPGEAAVGGAVYVPAYSHVYHSGGRPYALETTLSIRNTDLERPMFVRSVRYYDTAGELTRTFVDELIQLDPLETIEFLVEQRDSTGGSGANFIVEWLATDSVNPPIVEAVMVGMVGTQGIAFSERGVDLLPID